MYLRPGTRIAVKPIVFFPRGVRPTGAWNAVWTTTHEAALAKYLQMLDGRDTFELAPLRVMSGRFTAAEYMDLCFGGFGLKHRDELGRKEECSEGVETVLAEILTQPFEDDRHHTRYTLPFCLSVLMVDPDKEWGHGGGRPLNGETNLGGGVLVIPSWHLDEGTLTSTLVHELGHTFGLVHSNGRGPQGEDEALAFQETEQYKCYYDLWASPSVMSYNKNNQTNATEVDDIPGCLLGDEIHALSGNKNVFPNLTFNPRLDFGCAAPGSCPPHDGILREAYIGPMPMVWCTSDFESWIDAAASFRLNDVPARWILGSHPGIGWVPDHMWHSSEANDEGWVSLEVTFPMPVELDRMIVYTEHSGQHHRAEQVQVEREATDGTWEFVKRVNAPGPDTEVEFPTAEAWRWRIALRAGASKFVVVRGLRFFKGDYEWFPPLGPHAETDFGETEGSRVSNLVEIQRVIRADTPSVGFDARSMWHSGKVNEKGWVSLEVTFPTLVKLDKIAVHSRHSGHFHRAKRVQIEATDPHGEFCFVAAADLDQPSGELDFTPTKARTWKLAFQGETHVVLRGLRFYIGHEEFYPPASLE